jgi:hypothetical protein
MRFVCSALRSAVSVMPMRLAASLVDGVNSGTAAFDLVRAGLQRDRRHPDGRAAAC